MTMFNLVFAVPLLTFASAAAALDAKPGLWESTTTSQMEGTAPVRMPDMSKLPADQRARIEQSTARGGGRPTKSVARQCMTSRMLETWEAFAKGERSDDCQRKLVDQSERHVKMTVSCNNGKSVGDMEIASSSSERISGKMAMAIRTDGGNRKMNVAFESRWLGADCGNIKPGERRLVSGG